MREETLPDLDRVAVAAAREIADEARSVIAKRGRFLLALSGGSTPERMLRYLAQEDVPWPQVYLFQVDERAAPAGSPERNLTGLHEGLLARLKEQPAKVYAMPVEEADLELAAASYAAALRLSAGEPPPLDLVHLGLGQDGHTASLVPNDPALDVTGADVAATAVYGGRRRLTLTFPAINRAHRILWIVTGAAKARALLRLRLGDRSIPAGRVRRDNAVIFSDLAANGAQDVF